MNNGPWTSCSTATSVKSRASETLHIFPEGISEPDGTGLFDRFGIPRTGKPGRTATGQRNFYQMERYPAVRVAPEYVRPDTRPLVHLEIMSNFRVFTSQHDCWAIVPLSVAEGIADNASIKICRTEFKIPKRVTYLCRYSVSPDHEEYPCLSYLSSCRTGKETALSAGYPVLIYGRLMNRFIPEIPQIKHAAKQAPYSSVLPRFFIPS